MSKRGENIYKRRDGRYEGRYVIGKNENGTTKFGYVYGYQYGAVKKELLQKKAQRLENRGEAHQGKMSVAHWLDDWLSTCVRGHVRQSSFQTYQTLCNKHILPRLGALDIAAITPEDVQDFLGALRKSGLSESTIRGIYRILKAMMNDAQEDGMIRKNPCKKIRLETAEPLEQRVLSRNEQEKLRCAAGDHLPTMLGLYTGMRLGEICALRWSDIDWEQRTITVRRTVQRVVSACSSTGKKTFLMIGKPKTKRSRRVLPMPAFLLELLEEQARKATSEYVLGTRSAAEPRTIQRQFKRIAEKCGLGGVHFHTLRHSFATRMLELGVDVKTVSALLGHSSAKITLDVYVHSLFEQQRIAMEKMAIYS